MTRPKQDTEGSARAPRKNGVVVYKKNGGVLPKASEKPVVAAPPAAGEKPKRKVKRGTVARRECRFYGKEENENKILIPRATFERLVRELVLELGVLEEQRVVKDEKTGEYGPTVRQLDSQFIRLNKHAATTLQNVAEVYMAKQLEAAAHIMRECGRKTLMGKDLLAVEAIKQTLK